VTAALAPALDVADWQARRAAHEQRVDAWLTPHLGRRRAGVKHPVEDFLFTYYSHRPAQEQVRHSSWPLRLSPAATAAVVEERGVRCSHFEWGVCKRHEADNKGPSR